MLVLVFVVVVDVARGEIGGVLGPAVCRPGSNDAESKVGDDEMRTRREYFATTVSLIFVGAVVSPLSVARRKGLSAGFVACVDGDMVD